MGRDRNEEEGKRRGVEESVRERKREIGKERRGRHSCEKDNRPFPISPLQATESWVESGSKTMVCPCLTR